MLIEQAVFTSAQTRRADGYQIVARSPGLSDDDARDLTVWGPSHDSLLREGAGSVSLNFHPLASGAYCVSRTIPAGAEYSARGGCQVYTHCLVVPLELLARFANNPFALVRAAVASGHLRNAPSDATQLAALRLAGRHADVDRELLTLLAKQGFAAALARLSAAVLQGQRVFLVGAARSEQFVAGLVNCLPVAFRTQISFSTGLKASGCRPFRMTWLGDDRVEARRAARQQNAVVFDVDAAAQGVAPSDGWAGLVAKTLAANQTAALAEASSQVSPASTAADIDAVADRLRTVSSTETVRVVAVPIACTSSGTGLSVRRADAPCRSMNQSPRERGPAEVLSPQLETVSAETIELLECLDDAVFEAIRGDADAMPRVELLWPVVLEQVGPRLIDESRRQYLRYALASWKEQAGESPRLPDTAAAALEVLCVLFGDGEE